jgi:two-component SAPR family response regulator
MSDCHSSARCDQEQRVMIASSVITTTVHNVRQMVDAMYGDKVLVRGDGSYRGFTKNEQGHRTLVKRLEGETIWTVKE